MENRTLRMKKGLHTALLVLLLSAVGMGEGYAYHYDFAAVCETGQTLFYRVISGGAIVTYPCNSTTEPYSTGYGFSKPKGNTLIPTTVMNNGISYSVIGIDNYALKTCSELSSITIPSSITSIGEHAFDGCTGLGMVNYTGTISQWCNINFSTNPCEYAHKLKINGTLITNLTIPSDVTSIGNRAFSGCTCITSVTIGSSVTSIGHNAFDQCTGLVGSLTIPESVTSIGKGAFYKCTGLTQVYWNAVNVTSYPTDINPFAKCTNITKVVFGDSVQTIPDCAFKGFTKLSGYLDIPNSVTSIGADAFSGCTGLTGSFIIPEQVTSIGADAFSGCTGLAGSLTIPNHVISIGSGAFEGCTGLTQVNWNAVNVLDYPSIVYPDTQPFRNCVNLTKVVWGNSVQTIPSHAFRGCTGLTGRLVIPNSVVSIGDCAFSGCTGLTGSLIIPNQVTSIGESAFSGCTGLTSVTIGNAVPSIKHDTFLGCSQLTSVILGNQVASIDWDKGIIDGDRFYGAFYNCEQLSAFQVNEGNIFFKSLNGVLLNYEQDTLIRCPQGKQESFDIPTTVTTILDDAFDQCKGLVSVNIPNSVTSIGNKAFRSCESLTSITIPKSVSTIGGGDSWNDIGGAFRNCYRLKTATINSLIIGENMFMGCDSLTSIVFGNTVTTIGNRAFCDCAKLSSANIPNSVKTIGDEAFYKCYGLSYVKIPDSLSTIGSSAFEKCNSITSVVLPSTTSRIGENAFRDCYSLTNVVYNAINALCNDIVFRDCSHLSTVYVGSDVEEISGAFYGCENITSVVAFGQTPPTLSSNAFSSFVNNCLLTVPCGKRETYYSAWNVFPMYKILEDCDTYPIWSNAIGVGGNIYLSSTNASMGDVITFTVSPNSGMNLTSIIVHNSINPMQIIPVTPIGKSSFSYSFTMPPFGVTVTATFETGSSVNEFANTINANIYPNPTNSQVKIEAENLKHITISNLLGQIIYEGNASGNEFVYDFSEHDTGLYLIKIETASGVVLKKVSVAR